MVSFMDQDNFVKSLTSNLELLEQEAIREKLELTYEQRIESHENARILMEDLIKAGEDLRAKSQRFA